MNTELMNQVADAIEYSDRFTLKTWGRSLTDRWTKIRPADLWEKCDTVGCVAGWTNSLIEAPDIADVRTARTALGLTVEQAMELFEPSWSQPSVWGRRPYSARAPRAAKVLREIASGKRTFACDRVSA